MSDARSTVEINGKIYNMKSGQVLGSNPRPVKIEVQSGDKIDGFVGKAVNTTNTISHQHRVSKAKINHTARRPERSNTLIRSIGKPSTQHVTSTHKAKPGEFIAKSGHATGRSEMIKKFHKHSTSAETPPVKKVHANVTVKKPEDHIHSAPPLTIQELEDKFKARVVDPFEEAIKDASSHIHELQAIESPASRIKKIFHPFGSRARTSLTSVVLLSAFVIGVYQAVPSVKVKMASLQASIPASLPAYQPTGFGIAGPIKAEPGKVTLTYKSNSNDSNYKLTQQASNWSSQSLLNNQVLASSKPFQTYQQNGKTVYVYENNSAVWVDGGILYSIEGGTSLGADQLLKIAESL